MFKNNHQETMLKSYLRKIAGQYHIFQHCDDYLGTDQDTHKETVRAKAKIGNVTFHIGMPSVYPNPKTRMIQVLVDDIWVLSDNPKRMAESKRSYRKRFKDGIEWWHHSQKLEKIIQDAARELVQRIEDKKELDRRESERKDAAYVERVKAFREQYEVV